jgi:hypothetical protein
MVVGGFAAVIHGEPRLTVDVDIVVEMGSDHAYPFMAAFPPDVYYVNEETVRDGLKRRRPFNVIESATGAKVDLIPVPEDAFSRAAMGRRRRLVYGTEGQAATFISAEDVVRAKLLAYRETGSDRHLRDARGVLATQTGRLDMESLREGAAAEGTLASLDALIASLPDWDANSNAEQQFQI